jgi:hypothetical protein
MAFILRGPPLGENTSYFFGTHRTRSFFNMKFSELYELLDVKNSCNSYNSLKFVLKKLCV